MAPVVNLVVVLCACAGDVINMATSASGFVSPNDVGAASATGKAIIVRGDIMIGGLFPFHEIGTGDQVCIYSSFCTNSYAFSNAANSGRKYPLR